MGVLRTVALLLTVVVLALAWPRRGRSEDFQTGGFIGEASNELSTAILQSYVDDDSNLAFSPLGYSVILAILAEGAKGETKTQLSTALKLPEDKTIVRNMYQGIMKRLHNTNEFKLNTPEFKNWFYVYKNYTIEEDYRKILEEFYLTEVKSVERYDSSFFQVKKDSASNEDDVKVEQIDPIPSVEMKEPIVKDLITTKDNSKDVHDFDKLQKEPSTSSDKKVVEGIKEEKKTDEPKKDEIKKEEIKVEETEKKEKEVEKPKEDVKSEETKKENTTPKHSEEKIISFAMEDKPEMLESELYDKQDLIKPGKNIKEKIKLANTFPKKNQELNGDFEIMEAVEARNHPRTTKSLFGKDDVSNSLSANRVGSKDPKNPNSLMILFNGLYFRGSWKTPFKNVDSDTFYKSPTEKKSVPMMMNKGIFKTGSLPGLDSVAVELPYEGDRYALVVVVPRARDGLRRLVADLPGLPPARMAALLRSAHLRVRLPSFFVEVTTKPLAALAKFGVSSIFGQDADLSGISPVQGLFVQEMVQHVSIKVDDEGNSNNHIAVANPSISERSEPIREHPEVEVKEDIEEFVVDRPFLFFVRDVVDNIVVLAGKVTDPMQQEPFE